MFIKSIKLERQLFAGDTTYLQKLPLLAKFTEMNFTSSATFITGDNGTGKSTLAEYKKTV